MINRKSDATRQREPCAYHEQMRHERLNQIRHERLMWKPDSHDQSPCWCCCTDCSDLSWHYPARKGTWWQRTPSGALQLMRETCAESPGSPETKPSS